VVFGPDKLWFINRKGKDRCIKYDTLRTTSNRGKVPFIPAYQTVTAIQTTNLEHIKEKGASKHSFLAHKNPLWYYFLST